MIKGPGHAYNCPGRSMTIESLIKQLEACERINKYLDTLPATPAEIKKQLKIETLKEEKRLCLSQKKNSI